MGAYCLHRSWGFGKIIEYDAAQDRLIIDFEDGKDGHAMAPAFCVDKLEILAENDILVRSRLDKSAVDAQIKKEPVEIVIAILDQTEGKMMVGSEIERVLGRLMGPVKAKKWWTNTKKLLQKDPRIGVPAKKTEPFVLRDEPIKPEDEILELFHQTKNPKEKISLGDKLYSLSENISVIREELPEILRVLTEAIQSTKSLVWLTVFTAYGCATILPANCTRMWKRLSRRPLPSCTIPPTSPSWPSSFRVSIKSATWI